MFDANDVATQAIQNLDYRFDDILDNVLRALSTDYLADIALFLIRTYDDTAELNDDDLNALYEYANNHGIEG